jgi:hypothetical protein
MRNMLSTLAEIAGMGAITVGVALYSIPAAFITAGVALIAVGYGVDL